MDGRGNERAARRPAEAEGKEVRRRLAALEREIEEHRRWLGEDPLLRRGTPKAA